MKKLLYVIITTLSVHISAMDPKKLDDKQENHLFSHGLGENHSLAKIYAKYHIIGEPYFTFDYPDVPKYGFINFAKVNLGQDDDIEALHNAYKKTAELNKDLVLVGMSRGAATILNFVGKYNPKQIKALVVESPFDSSSTLSQIAVNMFKKHNKKGVQPIDSIENILNKELPILFICLKNDFVVPQKSTLALYKKLRQNGHKNIHVFVAKHGYTWKNITRPRWHKISIYCACIL